VTKAIPINFHAALLLEYVDKEGKKKKFLVISDLHLGSEIELIKKGINIDSHGVSRDLLREIQELKALYSFDGVIILGDLKSSILHITKNEWETIPFFLKELSLDMDIFLIPGNHDVNINLLVPDSIMVCKSSGLIIDDILFIHGHTIPEKTQININKIIMGHIHPIFINANSIVHGKRLWIYLKVKKESIFGLKARGMIEIIIIPTFNKYFYSLRYHKESKSISPLIRQLINNDAILSGLLFTLEGSLIGETQEIKNLF